MERDPLHAEFIRRSRAYLSEQYLPKIRESVRRLPEEDLWWRPNPASNSVGNLILHLAGNVRQWVVAGVAGEEDVRDRPHEFAAEDGLDADGLLAHLEETLARVDDTLAGLDPTVLEEARTIQGMETTGFGALYHAVEHFAMHTGQILWITKMRTGEDLGFYSVSDDGSVSTHW